MGPASDVVMCFPRVLSGGEDGRGRPGTEESQRAGSRTRYFPWGPSGWWAAARRQAAQVTSDSPTTCQQKGLLSPPPFADETAASDRVREEDRRERGEDGGVRRSAAELCESRGGNLLPGDEGRPRRAGGHVRAGQGGGLGAGCEIQGCRPPAPLQRKQRESRRVPTGAPATACPRWGGPRCWGDSVEELGSAALGRRRAQCAQTGTASSLGTCRLEGSPRQGDE